MNYIKHLTGFFDKIVHDFDLNPTHVSLYIALFQFWNVNRFENPISISRDEVMRISKICSKATYHKCMKELHEKSYINYEPSYNPFKGSLVRMINLSSELKPQRKKVKTAPTSEQLNEQLVNKQQTSIETSAEQVLVPYINNINSKNYTNISNGVEQKKMSKNKQFNNLIGLENENSKKKLREKKEMDQSKIIPPELFQVVVYFKDKNATTIDAEKFFNHFQSNGWLVGGKTKMKDWHAAARNWILNSEKFRPKDDKPRAGHLHVKTDKDYSEPL